MLRLVALILAFLPALASAVDWSTTATATVTWNSNLSAASRPSDVVDGWQVSTQVATHGRYSLTSRDAIVPACEVGLEAAPRFSALTTGTAGARLEWQRKLGLGAFAPTVFVTGRLAGIAARDRNRAGYFSEGTVGIRQRLTETWSAAASHAFLRSETRSPVYDTHASRSSLDVAFAATESLTFSGGTFWRVGDIVSHATPPRPDLVALAPRRQMVDTFDRPFVAYSIRARRIGAHVALTHALAARSSFRFGYEYSCTTRDSLRYRNHLVSASIHHSF